MEEEEEAAAAEEDHRHALRHLWQRIDSAADSETGDWTPQRRRGHGACADGGAALAAHSAASSH